MKRKIFTLTVVTLSLVLFEFAMRFEQNLSFVFLILSFSFFLIISLSYLALKSYATLENTEIGENKD